MPKLLYGFADRESRDFFKMIVEKVSGIGPKIGAKSFGFFISAYAKSSIAGGDVAMLSKAQGLGKKTAERIIVELKDKVLPSSENSKLENEMPTINKADPVDLPNGIATYQDAVSALLTLGYKATDADQAIRKASETLGDGATTEELIRKALVCV